MNEEQRVTGIATAPDWAPDNCPPDVVRLIADEQYLADLGLRGLGSAHSKELQQGVRKLRAIIDAAYESGTELRYQPPAWQSYRAAYLAIGYALGALCGALVVLAVM